MFVGIQGIGKTSLLSVLRREENASKTTQKMVKIYLFVYFFVV